MRLRNSWMRRSPVAVSPRKISGMLAISFAVFWSSSIRKGLPVTPFVALFNRASRLRRPQLGHSSQHADQENQRQRRQTQDAPCHQNVTFDIGKVQGE